ncbi:MAG: DUF115 domain-containing protein [Asgard group archaeon]|nr:DUF115 domain-containing protein [Asgard group archaeon]
MKRIVKLSKEDYEQICSSLSIDPETDQAATKVLHSNLTFLLVRKTLRKLKSIIKDRNILVFAPGPSLSNSLEQLHAILKNPRNETVVIAVDGAVKALYENDITVDAIVTDLDGSIPTIRESLKNGSIVVVHAHGDNITKIKEISDILPKEGIIGTTQTKETSKVKNLGGFTDGDRAAYLAANLQAKSVVFFGFDFGEIVGKFSKPEINTEDFQAPERKLIKFSFAKKLLSQLPRQYPTTKFYCFSNQGEEIKNIPTIQLDELEKFLIQ